MKAFGARAARHDTHVRAGRHRAFALLCTQIESYSAGTMQCIHRSPLVYCSRAAVSCQLHSPSPRLRTSCKSIAGLAQYVGAPTAFGDTSSTNLNAWLSVKACSLVDEGSSNCYTCWDCSASKGNHKTMGRFTLRNKLLHHSSAWLSVLKRTFLV